MLKISRLTDYGLLAAIYLARKHGEVISAREIAEFYHLPVPTVTKVLKALHQEKDRRWELVLVHILLPSIQMPREK